MSKYLYNIKGVAYYNLKPESILLDTDGYFKLINFRFAKQINNYKIYTLYSSLEYLTPEVIHNSMHGLIVD
jgi:serine/threonine protein kinase